MVAAEEFPDQFAQDAVALAVKDAYFLDAEQLGFVEVFGHGIEGFFSAFSTDIQGQVEVFGFLAEGIGESRLPFADGFSAFGATYLTEFVG